MAQVRGVTKKAKKNSSGGSPLVRLVHYFGAHLLTVVLLSLVSTWFIISWIVYRAEFRAEGANITSYGEGIWWGIVTFMTVGYGDRYPITLGGRVFAGFLMVAGVIVTAIVTAKISSYFMEQALRHGRGLVDTNRLKDHFIVCGCKEEMHELLTHILDFNPDLSCDQLVMIANVGQNMIDSLREQPRLKKLQVISGDFSHETTLQRAAPDRARKILILADRTPDASGHVPSMTEIDAKTIMTAMTLANIARGTLVAAEILDPKMDQYLKLASVSEVLYTRQYSRLLLGNASGGTGITNIIFDLLNPQTPTVITTHVVSETSLQQPYSVFKAEFENRHRGCVVIGILENTGNTQSIKELALRQAQKTPDIRRLVANLKSVKEIRCNHPILNPDENYRIPEGAMVIVIENRQSRGITYAGTVA